MRTFILLSVIAFALATPIDDKTSLTRPSATNPDISKLPLKKDDPSKDQVKVVPAPSQTQSGVNAHPLHKRANDPPKVADQSSGVKSQQTPSNVQTSQSSNIQHLRQPSNAPQNQQTQAARTPTQSRPLTQSSGQAVPARVRRDAPKIADAKTGTPVTSGVKTNAPAVPSTAPVTSNNNNNNQKPLYNQQRKPSNVRSPPLSTSSTNKQPSNVQSAKPAQAAPLNPSSGTKISPQSNGQPILSQNARVKRDAPKPVDTKTAVKPDSTLSHKAQAPAKVQTPVQGARVTRDAPKPVDTKTAVKPDSTLSHNAQAPAKVQTPVHGARVTRDAPKPVDTKTAAKPDSTLSHKAQTPAKVQTPVQGARVTRDAPKPVDTKTATNPASTLPQKSQAPSPVTGQKAQPTVAAKAPGLIAKAPVTNSRHARDAPNPHEQSKIVPSAYQPAKSNPDQKTTEVKSNDKKDDSSLSPAVAAKKPSSQLPQNKRESPPSNLRDSTLSSSAYDNQSPSFVHPVPVSQVLKKPENGPASVTVTKTDNTQIEPSLPTTEVKKSSVNDHKQFSKSS